MTHEVPIWVLGFALGYFVRRGSGENDIVFLVLGSIAIGTLATALSGEFFDHTLFLVVDVLQALLACLIGYFGPRALNRA